MSRGWIAAAVAVVLGVTGVLLTVEPPGSTGALQREGLVDPCGVGVTRDDLDVAVELGRSFLLNNQLPEGRFRYEYDWETRTDSTDDNEVRQAGATWGLSLVHQDHPDPEVRAALLRSLGFWATHSRAVGERRWPAYPGSRVGGTGTVALVALAHIELLRNPGEPLPPVLEARVREDLDGYLAMLLSLRHEDGRFHGRYDVRTGAPVGPPSPYADGETLLALVKAARYLGRDELRPTIVDAARRGYALNVTAARAEEPDSDTTKGYYQWASMSWFELADEGREQADDYGEWLIELAMWMVETHRTLDRTRNTAYAYEGLVPAWEIARRRGDPRAETLDCVLSQGVHKLLSWQVGHPLALPGVQEAPEDARSRGGVQNAADEAPLRIDVAQHQTHAMILARRYWKP